MTLLATEKAGKLVSGEPHVQLKRQGPGTLQSQAQACHGGNGETEA